MACVSIRYGWKDSGEFTRSTACGRERSGNTSRPSSTAAARPLACGTASARIPFSRAASAAERAPCTGRTPPSRESSSRKIMRSSGLPKNVPRHPRMPSAIGRSNAEPSLRTSAGARLMVTPWGAGKSYPQFFSADLIRSRLSLTAISGRPTTLNSPILVEPTSTSTSTRYASMPKTAALRDLKSMNREGRPAPRAKIKPKMDYIPAVPFAEQQSPAVVPFWAVASPAASRPRVNKMAEMREAKMNLARTAARVRSLFWASLLLASLSASLLVAGQSAGSATGDANALIKRADKLYESGDLNGAVSGYRQAASFKPNDPEGLFKLGLALADQEHLDEAAANCEKATALYQKMPGQRFNYAATLNNLLLGYYRQDPLNDALARIDLAIATWPRTADSYVSRGVVLEAKGKLEDAIEAYRKAVALAPRSADALTKLGAALQKKGQLDEAVSVLQRAVVAKPFDSDVFATLGDALAAKNQLDDAISAYARSVELPPTPPPVPYILANLHHQKRNTGAAIPNHHRPN